MEEFIATHRIPSNVGLRYCEEGDWYIRREVGEVVIPIIAFHEGDPHAFERHFHLVNKEDLEKVFKAEIFVNEAANQVRATHKILGYKLLQKSFSAPRHMIRAKDPRLHQIIVVEHGFSFSKGPSIPEGVPLAGSSLSHQAAEAEGGSLEKEREVVDLGSSKDEFGAFDQVYLSEDPSGDLGDPYLSEADLLPPRTRTGTQAEMGFKRQPQTSLFDLFEGQLGKDTPGKSQSKPPSPPPKLPPPPPKSLPTQTKSSSIPPASDSRPKSTNPKRKRPFKGKDPVDGGRSRSSQEEDETRQPSKQLRIDGQNKGKEVIQQFEPQA
nr:protein ENL-like [Quercus suber]